MCPRGAGPGVQHSYARDRQRATERRRARAPRFEVRVRASWRKFIRGRERWARGRVTCVYTREVTVTRKAVHARRLSPRFLPGKGAPLMPSEPAIPVRSLPCTPLAWAHTARGPPFCVFYVCRRRSLSCCFSVACCLRRSTLLLECMLLSALIGMHATQRWRRRALNADERFEGASSSRSLPSSPSPPSSSSSSSST